MRSDDPLEWLNSVLWPAGDGGFTRTAGSGVDGDPGVSWWATPDLEHPHTLVPTRPRRAAVRAARRYHDGKSWSSRARVLAAEAALSSSIVVGVGPVAPRIGATGLDRGVIGSLRELLADDLVVAVTLASPKSNRKPVLQLLAPDGECLGFAKVAPDPWNEQLVANEAAWLTRPTPASLETPDVVLHGPVGGRMVLVQRAILPPRLLRRRPLDVPPVTLFADVASLGDRRRAPVSASAWMRSVEAVLDHADPADRSMLQRVLADCDDEVELGTWHGDLAPWNLYTRRRSIAVIDWEFAAADVPVGFDLCHFGVQAANELLGLDAAASLRWARERIAGPLEALGVAPDQHGSLWRLYLVELVRRLLALRAAGLSTASVHHGPAALEYLRAVSPTSRMEVAS